MRVEQIGDCTLYNVDNKEWLEGCHEDFCVGALVTDPPYGINAARDRKSEKYGWKDYGWAGWDVNRADTETILAYLAKCKAAIIWGGNYFTDILSPSEKWLIWDKGQTDFSLADCELAWCSRPGAIRRITYSRAQALQDGKEHPTQKPIEVMKWCLGHLPKGTQTILDPYMGSGTTGVACVQTGHKFIGIEIDSKFFDIACRRIQKAVNEPRLELTAPPVANQVGLEF